MNYFFSPTMGRLKGSLGSGRFGEAVRFWGAAVITIAFLLVGWGNWAWSAELTWQGPSQLVIEPSEGLMGLFPGLSLSGNTVIVNSGPQLDGMVYGAVSDSNSAINANRVFISSPADITGGVAGAVGNGDVSANYAEVTGGQMVELAGGLSMSSSALNNEVVITGGSVAGESGVVGGAVLGFSGKGDAIGNVVTFGGTAYSDSFVIGGYVETGSGKAENNILTINGGTIGVTGLEGHGAYAGLLYEDTATGNANNNQLFINGGTILGSAYGGATMAGGNAEHNQVTVTGGVLNSPDRGSNIYGGFSWSGGASHNTVDFWGGQVFGSEDAFAGGIYGGFSMADGPVIGNAVNVYGGTLEWAAVGGISMAGGPAEDNTVTVAGGRMATIIAGGTFGGGEAFGNTIILTNGEITESLAAGLTLGADAHDNSIIVTGGRVGFGVPDGGIAGGLSMVAGDAYGNSVTVTGGTIAGGIIGGFLQNMPENVYSAHDNLVTISQDPDLRAASLYGGFYEGEPPLDHYDGDLWRGNVLRVWDYHGTSVINVQNFEFINFLLPKDPPAAPLLTATGTVFLGDNGRSSQIELITSGEAGPLNIGYEAVIIRAGQIEATDFDERKIVGYHGGILEYYWDTAVTNTDITARLVGLGASPGAKVLSEGLIGSMGLIQSAADLAVGLGSIRAREAAGQAPGSLAGFSGVMASQMKYKSGSHVETESLSFLTGLAYLSQPAWGDLTTAAFFEAGSGDYDSYNNFPRGLPGRGQGDTSFLGGGLMLRLDLGPKEQSHFHAEVSARGGQVKTSLNSARQLAGIPAISYDLKSPYFGAHLGAGYLIEASGAFNVDLYGQYLWSRQSGEEVNLSSGVRLNFKDVNSHRLRAGARAAYTGSSIVSPFFGAFYEHEFDGRVKATALGVNLPEPSIKGSTAGGELGLTLKPAEMFHIDLGLTGYVGKRQGYSGTLQLKYVF